MMGMLLLVVGGPGATFACVLVWMRSQGSRRAVQVARTNAVRAEAVAGAAVAEAMLVRGIADTAMAQTGQALDIAGTISTVDQNLTELTRYLVDRIEGTGAASPPRVGGRHSRRELTAGEATGERFLP